MKKLRNILFVAFALIVLSGCWNAQISSQTNITNPKGAGNKTISVSILKDGQKKPDGTGDVGNEAYLVKGWEGIDEWLKENTPDGFEVKKEETDTSYIYSITYEFKDIKEYNQKTKQLIGEETYNSYGFLPTTLDVEKTKNDKGVKGYNVTFTEDIRILYASVAWAFEGIFYNEELFNKDPFASGSEVEISDIYEMTSISIKIGDEETKFDLTAEENITLTEVTVTGFIEGSWMSTGLVVGLIVGAVVVVAGVVGLVVLKKKQVI